jgi:hypothetical protein
VNFAARNLLTCRRFGSPVFAHGISLMQSGSTLTCPRCGYQSTEQMPTDACRILYVCKGCGETLKPLPGDCCVFCSYGTVPCPPVQARQRRA